MHVCGCANGYCSTITPNIMFSWHVTKQNQTKGVLQHSKYAEGCTIPASIFLKPLMLEAVALSYFPVILVGESSPAEPCSLPSGTIPDCQL